MYRIIAKIYWIILSIIPLSFLELFIFKKIYIKGLHDLPFKNAFSNSLSFYLSVIGFYMAIIIFSVQFISNKFKHEELENIPIRNIYSIATLGLLFIGIIFNIIANNIELDVIYRIFSIIYLIVLIMLIIFNMIIIFYNMNIKQLLLSYSKKSISKLKKINIKNISTFKEKYSEVIMLYIKLISNSIITNENRILKISINDLNEILELYLQKTKGIFIYTDTILEELNDQFNFILEDALNVRNEKHLEDVVILYKKTIDQLIINRVNKIDNISIISPWIYAVENMFFKIYPKERSKACYICIDTIYETSLKYFHKQYYESADMIINSLENILKILMAKINYWSSILIQRILTNYQYYMVKIAEHIKLGKISDEYLSEYLEKFIEIIDNTKEKQNNLHSSHVIFASIYGLNSFINKLKNNEIFVCNNEEEKYYVKIIFIKLVDYHYSAIKYNINNNDYRQQNENLELYFSINNLSNLDIEDKDELSKYLIDNYLKYLDEKIFNEKEKIRMNSYLKEEIMHLFALMLFFQESKKEMLFKYITFIKNLYFRSLGKNINEYIGVQNNHNSSS